MLRHAASCFFTARNFHKAGEIFESLQFFGHAAECYLEVHSLSKAAQLYERANLVTKAIECYESDGAWEQLLHCLHRNKDFFKTEERQALINKYVPVALNSLYKLYSASAEEGEGDEENRGRMQEMKIKLKYQKRVNVIAEEDEEEESTPVPEAEEEPPVAEAAPVEGAPVKVEEPAPVEEGGSDSEIEVIEEEYDLLDEMFQLKRHRSQKEEDEKKVASSETSFEIIDTSAVKKSTGKKDQISVMDEEEAKAEGFHDDFEHLSQYDPDDEFLRSNKSMSIIDSILSGKKSFSKTSEFSMPSAVSKKVESLASMGEKAKNSIAFVESNRDIYAEDVITQKIIYYVSLFSEDVSEHLQKIRSKKVLFSNNSSLKDNVQEQEDLFILDLDDIDSNFVNLILDVLEYYELFRLCLMLCNRYHMSERLGRYLVSVCSKYSNLHLHRFNVKMLRAQNALKDVWLGKQRLASIIAHEALHNVFTLIEPKFLAIKQFTEPLSADNSLGMETYRTMLDLGFWKKLVYIGLPSETALQLCCKFFDRTNFDLLAEFIDAGEGERAHIQ
jgi:hypothetical protein